MQMLAKLVFIEGRQDSFTGRLGGEISPVSQSPKAKAPQICGVQYLMFLLSV